MLTSFGLLRSLSRFTINVSGLPIGFVFKCQFFQHLRLKMEEIGSPETSVLNKLELRSNPEDERIQNILISEILSVARNLCSFLVLRSHISKLLTTTRKLYINIFQILGFPDYSARSVFSWTAPAWSYNSQARKLIHIFCGLS
jgi:hypothetical protein